MAERNARALALLAGLCGLFLLGGCAAPVGDFGRADRDTVVMRMGPHPYGGPSITNKVRFDLSKDEIDLRALTWRYLQLPDGSPATTARPAAPDGYYRWIKTQHYASTKARFAKLDVDIRADLNGVPDVFASVCAVEALDRQRTVAARGTLNLDGRFLGAAAGRNAENAALIARFADALAARSYAYDYALDHLVVETPDPAAEGAGRALDTFEAVVKVAAAGAWCDRPPVVIVPVVRAEVRSRYAG